MRCKKCGHELSNEEIAVDLCWECGAILDETVDENGSDSLNTKSNVNLSMEAPKTEQNQEEGTEDESVAEYRTISAIHSFFAVLSILAVIAAIISSAAFENFWIAVIILPSTAIFYCFFRLLIAIAYLLCDIKENTAPQK